MRFETDDQKVWDLISTAEDEAAPQRFGTFNEETLGLCLEKMILGFDSISFDESIPLIIQCTCLNLKKTQVAFQ